VRWLYHIAEGGVSLASPYAPASLRREKFVHASFRDQVVESARVHFPKEEALSVLQIDPRRLDVPLKIDPTPRGPMPHIYGPIPADAIRAVHPLAEVDDAPDAVTGTRFAFVAFDGMTLLDLVGVYDPLSRIRSMGFDSTAVFDIVSATGPRVWASGGAELMAPRVRPPLAEYDVVIVPGGHGARGLARERTVIGWIEAFPKNRLMASVCTGALLLGAAGRLMNKRATTHQSAFSLLEAYGATPIAQRVVDAGQTVTAGGVTSALDLGIYLLGRFVEDNVVRRIAEQMEFVD